MEGNETTMEPIDSHTVIPRVIHAIESCGYDVMAYIQGATEFHQHEHGKWTPYELYVTFSHHDGVIGFLELDAENWRNPVSPLVSGFFTRGHPARDTGQPRLSQYVLPGKFLWVPTLWLDALLANPASVLRSLTREIESYSSHADCVPVLGGLANPLIHANVLAGESCILHSSVPMRKAVCHV